VVCIGRQLDEVRINERDAGQVAGSSQVEKAEDGIVKAGDVCRSEGMAFKEPQETIAVLEVSPRDFLLGEKIEDGFGEDRPERAGVVEFPIALWVDVQSAGQL